MAGKTSSIDQLDTETSVIIQALPRSLPKAANGKEFKKLIATSINEKGDKSSLMNILKALDADKRFKTIVLDDFHYIFGDEFAKTLKQKGFDKYNDYFVDYHSLFNSLIKLREDLFIHVMWHCDPLMSGNKIIKYEPKFIGSATKKYYPPLGLADIVLFAKPEFDNGEAEYGFYTKNFQDDNGIEYPARSVKGMFKDSRIENNLRLVEETYREYYKTEDKKV